ncbi:hypothetical protein XELAEV_180426611mg, partial [Xenopus laevis]
MVFYFTEGAAVFISTGTEVASVETSICFSGDSVIRTIRTNTGSGEQIARE